MVLTGRQEDSLKAILALGERLSAMVVERTRKDMGVEILEGRLNHDAIDKTVRAYQRFLALRVLHPDRPLRPTDAAGRLWHEHILDTRAYHADCQAIFGEFLHHVPNGVVGFLVSSATMWEMYYDTFKMREGMSEALRTLALTPEEVLHISVMATDCCGYCGGA